MDVISKRENSVLSHISPAVSKSIPSPFQTKEKILELTVSHLECERDSLLSTVADLRQLLKRITVQQDQEAQRKRNIQRSYQLRISALESALKTSEVHSSHFVSIHGFWQDFIN